MALFCQLNPEQSCMDLFLYKRKWCEFQATQNHLQCMYHSDLILLFLHSYMHYLLDMIRNRVANCCCMLCCSDSLLNVTELFFTLCNQTFHLLLRNFCALWSSQDRFFCLSLCMSHCFWREPYKLMGYDTTLFQIALQSHHQSLATTFFKSPSPHPLGNVPCAIDCVWRHDQLIHKIKPIKSFER